MPTRLQIEFKRLKKQIQILKNTEGFPKLTKFQQRFIINSLYLQVRHYRFDPMKRAYETTNNIHNKWFCHASVFALEEGIGSGYWHPRERFPNSFFVDDLVLLKTHNAVHEFLLNAGFPAVVHIGTEPENFGRDSHLHTCLSLGLDHEGQIVIWEKQGYHYPFRITNIDFELSQYDDSFWSARPLKPYTQETRPTFIKTFNKVFAFFNQPS